MLKMLEKTTLKRTLNPNTPGLATSTMVMRCEGVVWVMYILLDMIFVKTLIRLPRASHDLEPTRALDILDVNSLCGVKIYVYSCLYELFDVSSKASSLRVEVKGLNIMAQKLRRLVVRHRIRGIGLGRRLRAKPSLVELLAPLEVEVAGRIL
jgi:hypothetical protein